jgi:hypothetical protein
MKNEIILYRPNELAEHIEVRLENDTVWLSQEQISFLFQRDQSVISRHIRNVFRENELDEISNMQKLHIANSDKLVTFYNLDVIISVGYRVKSKQGTQFRIWATSVLRDYLLKGYAINQRVDRIENNLENLTKEIGKISLQLKTNELPTQGVFFNGQIFDAYELMSRIIRSATKEIILIDNYIDETVLTHLGKRTENVAAIIYTKSISKTLKLDLEKHNNQYPPIQLQELRDSHDRFLIIDRKELYHIGASLKDLGKKWFAFSKLDNKMLAFVLSRLLENQA